MSYYDYLIGLALKKNELKEFLMGSGEYKERPIHEADDVPLSTADRLLYLINNKKHLINGVFDLILQLLRGDANSFLIGLNYVCSVFYNLKFFNDLKINYADFLKSARDIIVSRKQELQSMGAWDNVELQSEYIKQFTGMKLI